ncbi:AMP-dependent synthetase/ligase [Streptomyces sp. Je 1-369]|uniref:AMP-dependent synthetase/ligase n=1 Tax=Streptomyces sp. Je 1-369 TaxID=2966192 RepID=UPI00228662DF|nr:AMP-dependent synthetase/ligase [Streptomyces sp. Je 1-369]WAL97170.1 AMP-dependent synthetase/ligase [Streptomyces sp. Je 1-369]
MQQTRKDPVEPPELPGTLALLAEWAAERHAGLPALRFRRDDGEWAGMSYAELRDATRRVGRALLALGVGPGGRVAVLAETRPEWTCTHFGVLAAGAVVVPVYPTAGDDEVAWVLSDSGAEVVICEDAARAAKVERLRDRLPGLRRVLLMTEMPGELGTRTALLQRASACRATDLATIIYTSGTTGPPKGCLLTHGNLLAVQAATVPLVDGGPGESTYLYLPLAHLLAQLIEFTTLIAGGTLTYFGGRIEDVVSELAEARPTHLPSVPRLFEKVRSVVLSLAEAEEGGRERFEEAVRIGVLAADGELPDELRDAYEAADKALYGLIRQALGGRVRWALTGGAPIAPDTVDFLRACGIAVYEGYGMTESAGVLTLNHPGAVRYGTVGRPVDGVELRIAEDGEVLARGAMVFHGYHNDPGATRDVLDAGGWLHTGDLGAVDDDGFLTITGRKKDLIITSGGKNLTPSLTELAIQTSRFVSRAVMVGDHRPYPVALVTLDAEEVTGWAAREGVTLTVPAARDPRVRALVQEAVDAANATASRPARIRGFTVLDEDFTVEGGLLTPSLKVRRKAVTERYAEAVEELYERGPAARL